MTGAEHAGLQRSSIRGRTKDVLCFIWPTLKENCRLLFIVLMVKNVKEQYFTCEQRATLQTRPCSRVKFLFICNNSEIQKLKTVPCLCLVTVFCCCCFLFFSCLIRDSCIYQRLRVLNLSVLVKRRKQIKLLELSSSCLVTHSGDKKRSACHLKEKHPKTTQQKSSC